MSLRRQLFILFAALSGLLYFPTAHAEDTKQLNFVVSLPAPPSRIYKVWKPFIQYLELKTGYSIELLNPKSLEELNHWLETGKIDFIYTNSYAYYLNKQQSRLEAIAQMRNKSGATTSRGRVLVRKDSGIKTVEDLRGGVVSLISPYGAGSYLAPKAFFRKHGLTLEQDISVSYSGDLKKSVYEVIHRDATAAVMCGVNYDIIRTKTNMNDIHVIELTDEFPEGVIAVKPSMDSYVKQLLKINIINMSKDFGGQKSLIRLRNTKIYDFIEYDPSAEKHTESLIQKAGI